MSEGPPRLEVLQVMDDDVVPRNATPGNRAAPIHGAQGATLRSVGETLGGAEVQPDAVGADDDRRDLSDACHAADRFDREVERQPEVDDAAIVLTVEQA